MASLEVDEDLAAMVHEVPLQIAIAIEAGPGPRHEAAATPVKGAKVDKKAAEAAAAAAAAEAAAAAAGTPLSALLGTSFTCSCGADVVSSATHEFSAADAPTSTLVTLRVTAAMVFAYAREGGGLKLTLLSASAEPLCAFVVDMMPLVRAEQAATGRWSSERDEGAQPIDEAGAVWVRRLAVTVALDPAFGTHLLGPELGARLNPLTVELARAEDLPADFSGSSARGGPYEELARCCQPVQVSWALPLGLGAFCSSAKPHARALAWGEKQTVFAGLVDASALAEALCAQPLEVLLRDRDALARARPEPRAAAAPPAADGAASDVESHLRQPFGVGLANLSLLVPKASGDAQGMRPFTSRRATLCVQLTPSPRPRGKAPSDASSFPFYAAESLPYHAGRYVEAGATVTLKVETLLPLGARPAPSGARLQRALIWMAYADNALLHRIGRVVDGTNAASGLNSASAWAEYRGRGSEALDVLTGFQLTDGRIRLFVLEGAAAAFAEGAGLESDAPAPLNGMGALAVALERKAASETLQQRRYLLNWEASFPVRLYDSFETPTKLIKLRQPFHELMRAPAPYVHGRVSADCALALTRMYNALQAERLRDVHKYALWAPASALHDLEKKFGDVLTVADRKGVPQREAELAAAGDERDPLGAARAAVGARASSREGQRGVHKASTDASMPESFAAALHERAAREAFDFVARNAEPLVCANPARPQRTFALDRAALAAPDGEIYVYSSQRYASAELHKSVLRAQCKEEEARTGCMRTFNGDFLAAAEIVNDQVHEARAPSSSASMLYAPDVYVWDKLAFAKTGNGWVLSKWQIKQPDSNRLNELAMPWDEAAGLGLSRQGKPPSGKPEFVVRAEAGGFFSKDPNFFRSIFIPEEGSSGAAAEEKAREQYEAHEWAKKVVVADTTWHAAKASVVQTTADKNKGMLHDEPMKRSIKALYRAKRPLIRVMPNTIFPTERMGEEFDFLKSLRPAEPDKWVAANPETGEPEDFLLHWSKNDTALDGPPAGNVLAPPSLLQETKPLSTLEMSQASFKRATLIGGGSSAMMPRVVSTAEFYAR